MKSDSCNQHKQIMMMSGSRVTRGFLIIAICLVAIGLAIPTAASTAGAQSITLDGRLTNAAGDQPLLDASVVIDLKIMNPAGNCILYEESQHVDTTATEGRFTIQVGSAVGDPKRVSGYTLPMTTIFQNATSIVSSSCSYTPVGGDGRILRVTISPSSTGNVEVLSPDTVIDSVPNALVAETLQGLDRDHVLAIDSTTALSQSNVANIFSSTNYPALTALLGGTSSQYVATSSSGGAKIPSVAGVPTTPAAGQIWFNSSANAFQYYNGSAVQTLGVAGSGISTLTVGSSLTANGSAGGTLNSSGTIDIVNSGVTAGTYPKVTVNSKGLVTYGSGLIEGDIPNLTTPGHVLGDAIINGTIGGSTAFYSSGNVTTSGTVQATFLSSTYDTTRKLTIYGTGSSYGISLSAPVMGANYSLVFPASQGAAGSTLVNDGTGNLSWVASSSGSVTSVGLTLPSIFNVTNPVVTSTGNLSAALANQNANLIFAGPASGGAAVPSFRGLAVADLPAGCDASVQKNTLGPGQIWVGNSAGIAASVTPFGDVIFSIAGSATVTQLQGRPVSATAPSAAGQVLRWSGSAWTPNFVAMTDLRSTITGNNSFQTSCAANQTLTYNSVGDMMSCSNIAIANTQVAWGSTGANLVFAGPSTGGSAAPAFRALTAADLPTGIATQWNTVSTTINYLAGFVGIGTASPQAALDIYGTGAASAMLVPRDTAAARPTGVNGMIRYNTSSNAMETYSNGAWTTLTTAAAGASQWTTNGSMIYYNSGNVGIGTATPGSSLQIYTNTSTDGVRITGSSLANDIGFFIENTASGGHNYSIKSTGGGAGAGVGKLLFKDETFGAWRMVIDPNGLIGFNTIYPKNILDVNGAVAVGTFAGNNTAPANSVIISGSAGIGTATPQATLDVYGTGSASAMLVPRDSASARPTGVNGMIRYNTTSNAVETFANGSWTSLATAAAGASQWISSGANIYYSSGNVGIGTNSPNFALDMNVGTTANGGINLSGSGVGGPRLILNNTNGTAANRSVGLNLQSNSTLQYSLGLRSGDGHFYIYDEVAGAPAVDISSGGAGTRINSSIKTEGSYTNNYSPTAMPVSPQLELQNDGGTDLNSSLIHFSPNNSANHYQQAWFGAVTTTNNYTPSIVFGQQVGVSGYSERMRIDPNGYVGIGSTAPQTLLDINGTGAASAVLLPRDTTAGRPSGVNGMLRYNTSLQQLETYSSGAWASLGSGAGSGSSQWTTTGSNIYYTTGKVGIGTNAPGYALDVTGGINLTTTLKIGGYVMLAMPTNNTNTAVGNTASSGWTGGYNTATGAGALGSNTSGTQNVAIGANSLATVSTSSQNVAVGTQAMAFSTGANNTALGSQAMMNGTGASNVLVGYQSGYDLTSGSNNIIVGPYASIGVGVTSGSNNILIGQDIRPASQAGSNQLNIGNLLFATGLGSGATLSSGALGIGSSAPQAFLDVNGSGTTNSAMLVPRDSTGNRPAGINGMLRYNTSNQQLESFAGGSWTGLASSASVASSATQWTTSGANIYYNSSTGNVGIGTASPSTPLHIANGSSAGITLQKTGSPSGTFTIFDDGDAHFESGSNKIWFNGYGNGPIYLAAAGGAVGIGTNSAIANLDLYAANATFDLRNSGDSVGVYMQDTYASGQFGMVNPTGSAVGVIGANSYRAFFAYDINGRVGSVTNGNNAAPIYRNLLDDGSGKMGIGTSAPAALLDVYGSGTNSAILVPRATIAQRPTSPVNGMIRYQLDGQTLETYVAGTWTTIATALAGASQWITSSTTIYYNAGSVGIGTATPASLLDVNGEVRMHNSGTTCSSTIEGAQRYNSTAKRMEVCSTQNGSYNWVSVGNAPGTITATGSATCPNGSLLANGTSYAATTYPALCLALLNAEGGTSNAACTSGNFNVPDLRGRFLRGVDGGVGNDPDASSRTAMNTGGNTGNNVGSIQGDQYASHNHTLTDPGHVHAISDPGHNHTLSDPGHGHIENIYNGAANTGGGGYPAVADKNNYGIMGTTTNATSSGVIANATTGISLSAATTGISVTSHTTGITLATSGGNETRAKNAYVNYCVYY